MHLLDFIRDLFDLGPVLMIFQKKMLTLENLRCVLSIILKIVKGLEGYESEEDYKAKIDAVRAILKKEF